MFPLCRYPGFIFETTNRRFFFYRVTFPGLIRRLLNQTDFISELTQRLKILREFSIDHLRLIPTNKGWFWIQSSRLTFKRQPHFLRMSYESTLKLIDFLKSDSLSDFYLGDRKRIRFKYHNYRHYRYSLRFCNPFNFYDLFKYSINLFNMGNSFSIKVKKSGVAHLREVRNCKTISSHALRQFANYERLNFKQEPD